MDRIKNASPVDPVMVAPRLAAIRTALDMNKTDFARMIGVDKSSYTKIEKGEKPLLTATAYKIYELYGVDLNFIYLGQVGGLPSRLSNSIISHLNSTIIAS